MLKFLLALQAGLSVFRLLIGRTEKRVFYSYRLGAGDVPNLVILVAVNRDAWKVSQFAADYFASSQKVEV